jgi:hypothetical protein
MGSGPNFSKLKQAIKTKSVERIVDAMFNLKFRDHVAKTHGGNIVRETNRALRHLKMDGQRPDCVQEALRVAQERAGDLWSIPIDELEKVTKQSGEASKPTE